MFTACVFVFLRLSPLLSHFNLMLNVVVIVGSLTAFYSALTATVQHDIKKIIAYSTCSQLAYMLIALVLSHFSLSFFHLINHAFFKALLFLTAGSFIHIVSYYQYFLRMCALVHRTPVTFIFMLVGTLAIVVFPFLTCFYSKYVIIEVAYNTAQLPNN
jgi:NADH-ubiquinone oxidoreductase chain 5